MRKAGHAVDRSSVHDLQQIVNVGPSMAKEFRRVDLGNPVDLIGQEPFEVFEKICRSHGSVHDPCVLDCVWSAIDYMNGRPPRKWWDFTPRRKTKYGQQIEALKRELS